MQTFCIHRTEDGRLTVQEHEYIEDGWIIEIDKEYISLYEIPLHGGDQVFIAAFKTLPEAIDAALELT